MRATYVGTDYPDLQGMTAMVRRHKAGLKGEGKTVLAQFDSTGLGIWSYGWWDFHPEDFILISEEHEDVTLEARFRANRRHNLRVLGRVHRNNFETLGLGLAPKE